MRYLVTGSAGFIGFHLVSRLLSDGHDVVGFDAMTDYYDVTLKRARHALLSRFDKFTAIEARLEDQSVVMEATGAFAPDIIVHLAAQAGVRYSIESPESYVSANLDGTFSLLEAARAYKPRHLLVASTSSVYGGNQKLPFREVEAADHPISFYAATKKAGEAMSHAYAHLFGVPTTCFRFFTVYGPWGRPDMALFKFTAAMLRGESIDVYGEGRMRRDFTYVGDLVEAIVQLADAVPIAGRSIGVMDSISPVAPWRVVNIAGGQPVELLAFIRAVEAAIGTTATTRMLPLQAGDPVETFADASLLEALTGYRPATAVPEGVAAFVAWYRDHYGV